MNYNNYYIPNDSKWHVERGQIYKINPNLNFMKVPDRSIFTLQQFGISFSENEYLAIKLHDGLYEDSNKAYFISYSEEYALKTYLPHVLHQADMIAAKSEEKK